MRKRALAAAILAGMATHASAFQIDTNNDWSVRWDNTVKYNVAMRVATRDKDVTQAPGLSAGLLAPSDGSFDRGDVISNRVDVLSELDVVWKDTLGFRISGAGWYDHAYRDGTNIKSFDGFSPATSLTGLSAEYGELNDDEEKYHYKGGELLDAFVFWNWEAGDVQGNLRAGRHVIYWGQSLLATAAINSAGGAMNPIDFGKGLSVPGSEAKELFMPTNKVSTLIQLTDSLSVAAYYSFEWDHYRLPVGNTYFSPSGAFGDEIDLVWAGANTALAMQDNEEPGSGEWGINFAYYFEDLGLEAQLYYLNTHEKIQNGLTTCLAGAASPNCIGAGSGLPAGGTTQDEVPFGYAGQLKWAYQEDVDLYGLSLAKQVGDVSVGVDITHRKDTALRPSLLASFLRVNTDSRNIDADPTNNWDYDEWAAIDEDNYALPTGDTWAVVVNALGLLNDNGFWEGGTWIVEMTFSMLDEITNDPVQGGPGLIFQGGNPTLISQSSTAFSLSNAGGIPGIDDGRVNSDTNVEEKRVMSHIGWVFKPTWYQVFPGTDMSVIFAGGYGIDGNSYTSFGGDEESGSATLGVEFLVNQKWSATLRYNDFFGPQPNTFGNNLKDRDNISLTFKRTF